MRTFSEDNKDMALSRFMQEALNIEFLDGNGNITEYIEDNIPGIYYMDLVPDNDKLRKEYNTLLSKIIDNEIFIVPIICSEYYVIQCIKRLNLDFNFKYNWYNVVLEAILSKVTINKPYPPRKEYKYKSNFDSLEQQCKLLLSGADSRFRNYNIINSKDAEELNLKSFYLNLSDKLTILSKSIEVARQYPIVVFRVPLPDGFNYVDAKMIVPRIQASHDIWMNSYKKIKLPDNWWLDENVPNAIEIIRNSK